MSTVDPIKIKGLRELQAGLKAVEDGAQKGLRVALNRAVEVMAADARAGVPARSGRARASIKTQSGQREAKIIGGGKKAPYYGWLDFGGRVGRDKTIRRPVVPGGRYMYPAFSRHRQQMLEDIAAELAGLAAQHGVDMDVTRG